MTNPNWQKIAEDLALSLKGLSDMYVHAWDLRDGGLFMSERSVAKFEKLHAQADKQLSRYQEAVKNGGAE